MNPSVIIDFYSVETIYLTHLDIVFTQSEKKIKIF